MLDRANERSERACGRVRGAKPLDESRYRPRAQTLSAFPPSKPGGVVSRGDIDGSNCPEPEARLARAGREALVLADRRPDAGARHRGEHCHLQHSARARSSEPACRGAGAAGGGEPQSAQPAVPALPSPGPRHHARRCAGVPDSSASGSPSAPRPIASSGSCSAKRAGCWALGSRPVSARHGCGRVISSLLFGIEPTDGASTALAIAVLAAAGTLADWLPARRASKLDPLRALRCE